MLYGHVRGACNDMKEARQKRNHAGQREIALPSGQMHMTLKRAGETHMSTSYEKLRLLVEGCVHVPTTRMRVNCHFRHHTFLFPW